MSPFGAEAAPRAIGRRASFASPLRAGAGAAAGGRAIVSTGRVAPQNRIVPAAIGALSQTAIEYVFPGNDDADAFAVRFVNGVRRGLRTGGWRGSCGVRYEGTDGSVSAADGYEAPDASSAVLLADRARLLRDYRGRAGRALCRWRHCLDSVRSRRPSVAKESVARESMTICHAINIAMPLRRNLRWDPSRSEFAGDPEANRMRARAARPPWLA